MGFPRLSILSAHGETTPSCNFYSLQAYLSSRHHTKMAFSHWCFIFLYADCVNKLLLQLVRKVASFLYLDF